MNQNRTPVLRAGLRKTVGGHEDIRYGLRKPEPSAADKRLDELLAKSLGRNVPQDLKSLMTLGIDDSVIDELRKLVGAGADESEIVRLFLAILVGANGATSLNRLEKRDLRRAVRRYAVTGRVRRELFRIAGDAVAAD